MRPLAFLFFVAAVLLLGSRANAQARSGADAWLLVPALGGAPTGEDSFDLDTLTASSEAFRRELAARDYPVWPSRRASERYEVVGSAPAPELSENEIERWVESSRAAVRYLARADYRAARRELRVAQKLADGAAEELNREAARAQQVLDTCLFMVRAYLETESESEARRQARECRQLVPRVEPTAFRHTPEVRQVLHEVDAAIAAEAPGSLSVRSTPPGCVVRINGVELGKTPLFGIELPVATYRVQVECDEGVRGRIHRLAIRSGPNDFRFDASLERAVRTRPALHLGYPSAEAWGERMSHGAVVAGRLGSRTLLVVSAASARAVRADFRADGRRPASVWLPARDGAPSAADVRRALDAILEGRSVDFRGEHPLARASWYAEGRALAPAEAASAALSAAEPTDPLEQGGAPRPRAQRIGGWTLFGAGVASIGASVGLQVWRGSLGESFRAMPDNVNEAQRWWDARIAVWGTAAFGGAAATAAMPLLLPEQRRAPWWGWTLGALGLGLSAYAIYEGVTMTSCPEPFIGDEAAARQCVARGQEAGRVALAVAGAAPLLSVPMVYSIRPLRAEPSVSVRGAGAVVGVRKAF